jgi:hypothetical protein
MAALGRFGFPVFNFHGCFSRSKKKIVPVLGENGNTNNNISHSSKSVNKEKGKEEGENIRLETFRNKPRALLASYASNIKQHENGSVHGKGRNIFKSGTERAPNSVPESHVNVVVVNDVLQFVHGLNLQPDKGRNPLMIGDMCTLVSYEHDGYESLGSSNPLGNFLLRAVLQKLNFIHATNVEEVNYLIMSIDIATTFIEYMRNMEEGGDQGFWIPLQGCLALTVSSDASAKILDTANVVVVLLCNFGRISFCRQASHLSSPMLAFPLTALRVWYPGWTVCF